MSKIQIRISGNDKAEFQNLAKEVGLTMSMAIRLFIKQSLNSRTFPFKLASKRKFRDFPNDRLLSQKEMEDFLNSCN